MKVLLIHAEHFEFKALSKAVNEAEEPILKEFNGNNALVMFTSVESGDLNSLSKLLSMLIEDIANLLQTLKPEYLVIYPYAHLSKDLANPAEALKVLKGIEEAVKSSVKGVNVVRAPFGWYKSFTIKCLGHPLSELSREYRVALEAKEEVKPTIFKCFIMNVQGDLIEVTDEEFKGLTEEPILTTYCLEKTSLSKWVLKPRLEELFKKFGYVLIRDKLGVRLGKVGQALHVDRLLSSLNDVIIERLTKDSNFTKVEVSSLGYSLNIDNVSEPLILTDEKGLKYEVSNDSIPIHAHILKELLGVKQVKPPLFMYEIKPVLKKSSELNFRDYLTALTKPQFTAVVDDLRSGLDIVKNLVLDLTTAFKDLNLLEDMVVIAEVSDLSFKEGLLEPILQTLRNHNVKALIKVSLKEGSLWDFIIRYVYIDSSKSPTELSKTALTSSMSRAFRISYFDKDNNQRYPVIITSDLIGAPEVLFYALLDKALKFEEEGKTPCLPTWLMPTQVMVIPVTVENQELVNYASLIVSKLRENSVRSEVDLRNVGLGRKIRDAGKEWIPFIVVVGEREVNTTTLNVRVRCEGIQHTLTLNSFIELLKKEVKTPFT
ncbi:MAG: hypothetical protein B7O98_02265 [Zestosphaera tikiterensis]|uniref:Threonine--tRNA ligase n=1 Tax=Zestosphaera tikiterensis TaxID=1973259 RepID=A0A2R7Y717_9CREN|nr:MAG: hypothetical protein B7O98_02265 [Zestosphaera tikiterensis]